jgi:DNA polymerase-3 subunit epsilon
VRQVFLDTETTGLSPESGDRIIEIGCVEIVNRRLTGRKVHFYVNPERRNSVDAYKVHGLSDEFLADKPLFGHIVDELIEFVRDAEIIIHNAAFDVGFLDAELRRIGRPAFLEHGVRVTDTLSMARDTFPASRTPSTPCASASRSTTPRASCMARCSTPGLLAEVYIRMTRGQDSLVIDAGDQTAAELAGAAGRLRRAHADRHPGRRRRPRRPCGDARGDRQGERRTRCLAPRRSGARPGRHGTMTAFRRQAFAPRAGG